MNLLQAFSFKSLIGIALLDANKNTVPFLLLSCSFLSTAAAR